MSQADFRHAIEISKPVRERRSELHSPLDTAEKSDFMSGVGSLHWLGGVSCPPIQAATSLIQDGAPTVESLLQVQSLGPSLTWRDPTHRQCS